MWVEMARVHCSLISAGKLVKRNEQSGFRPIDWVTCGEWQLGPATFVAGRKSLSESPRKENLRTPDWPGCDPEHGTVKGTQIRTGLGPIWREITFFLIQRPLLFLFPLSHCHEHNLLKNDSRWQNISSKDSPRLQFVYLTLSGLCQQHFIIMWLKSRYFLCIPIWIEL